MMRALISSEPFPECIDRTTGREVSMYGGRERRTKARGELHWPLRLSLAAHRQPLETRTENLSSEGFYCLVPEPLTPGRVVDCVLEVPWHGGQGEGPICLQCRARVVRVQPGTRPGTFGIGCRIEHYSVIVKRDTSSV